MFAFLGVKGRKWREVRQLFAVFFQKRGLFKGGSG